MSENLIQMKKSTNVKPNSWYEILCYKNQGNVKYYKYRDEITDKGMDSIDYYPSEYEFYKKYPIQLINTLEKNKQILEQIKSELINLGKLEENMKTNKSLYLCCRALDNGYLISQQLKDMLFQLDEYKSSEMDFYKKFKFKNYQQDLLNFIKPNIGWRNKERDFDIYMEIKKGTLYQEIAEKEEISIQAISQINSKV